MKVLPGVRKLLLSGTGGFDIWNILNMYQVHTENHLGERVTATGMNVKGTSREDRLKVVLSQLREF